MEYSQVSFNKITLNITSPKGEGVSLNKGEILKGLVQDIRQDGLIMLLIKGKLIEAVSEVMVKPGQQLFLMVDDLKDGKTYLKVVTPQMMDEIENANLSVGLRDIGVQAKEDNVILAKKLLQHNLPVTQDNLNNLARGVKILGETSPKNLELVAFAQSRDLNIDSATLNALRQFTTPENNLVKTLQSLLQTVSQAANQPDLSLDLSGQLRTLAGGEETVISTEPKITLTAGPKSEQTAAEITAEPITAEVRTDEVRTAKAKTAEVIINNNLDSSGKSDQLTEKAEMELLPPDPDSKGKISVRVEKLLKNFVNIMDPLLDLIKVDMENADYQAADKIRTIIKSEPEVIKGLLFLKDIFSGEDNKDILKNPVLRDLLQKIDSFEKELTGQRLFNAVAQLPGDNATSSYYFSFPIPIDNEYRLCQLKIDRDSGKKQLLEADTLNFVVSLDTSKLGLVLFHVNWQKSGELKIQGVVESFAAQSFLNKNINQLLEGLKGLGYRVTNLGIKIARDKDETNLRPQMKIVPDNIIKPFSIDVKV